MIGSEAETETPAPSPLTTAVTLPPFGVKTISLVVLPALLIVIWVVSSVTVKLSKSVFSNAKVNSR